MESGAEFAAALELDPNCADLWADLSDFSVLAGRVTEGLEQIRKALRLNPYPASWYYLLLGQAQYAARQYEEAIETLRKEETYRTSSRRFLAASLAQLGRLEEARREVEMFLVSNPHLTISHWVASQPLRDDATLAITSSKVFARRVCRNNRLARGTDWSAVVDPQQTMPGNDQPGPRLC